MIACARELGGDAFAWRREDYEFVSDRPAIDLLTGGPEYREIVDRGTSLDEYLAEDARGAAEFARERGEYLLY